ncbi:MAG: methyltransferase domain-containing protein [Desulforhopalus sp.]
MESSATQVANHYSIDDLIEKLIDTLGIVGKDIDTLTVDDLAPVDAFHTRGRKATLEAAALIDIKPSHRILDVGCGLGGTARFLADRYGCQVVGVDCTRDYITAGNRLNELVGLAGRVNLCEGDALSLMFDDRGFDCVWTEHVQMNIGDKNRFYSEIARVLKPGGHLLFHDVFRGTGTSPVYPVPWAENGEMSVLATEADARVTVEKAGLEVQQWINKTSESVHFFSKMVTRIKSSGLPPFGTHLLMGDNGPDKLENLFNNLQQDSLSVVLGLASRKLDE